MATLRIEYDDDALAIMENVNKLLLFYGLEFKCDELPHDGYEIYDLVATPPYSSPPFLGMEKETLPLIRIYEGMGIKQEKAA